RFLQVAERQDEAWATDVNARLEETTGGNVPLVWALRIDAMQCPAISAALDDDVPMTMEHLRRHPSDRDRPLDCVPLLLVRSGEPILLPDEATRLAPSDAVLFAGTAEARHLQSLTARHRTACDY